MQKDESFGIAKLPPLSYFKSFGTNRGFRNIEIKIVNETE